MIDPFEIKQIALRTGYTLEGWRFLFGTEMCLRLGSYIPAKEREKLRSKALDPEWSDYCNRKARGEDVSHPALDINDLFH